MLSMKKLQIILSLLSLLLPATAQQNNQAYEGRDFWVGFIADGGSEQPKQLSLIAYGDTACTITANNPLMGWQQTISLSAGSSVAITLPVSAQPEHYSSTETKGFHITSTAHIHLIAQLGSLASRGVSSILRTEALRTRYIVLDYPSDPTLINYTGASVCIVATENNTTIEFTPPCNLYALSGDPTAPTANSPTTHTFATAGQTLTLMANSANATLSGMEITSDKPIAVFQGNRLTGVPHSTPSGDLLYDQTIPVEQWGQSYALVPTRGRSVGDRVRVVADSACTVTLSTGSSYTLTSHGATEFDLPANQPCILTSTKPVSVGLCSKGSTYGGELGDGSLVMLTPMEHTVTQGRFITFASQRINSWFVTVTTNQPSTMTLDGSNIYSQFGSIGSTGYSYARINITNGVHSLANSAGSFTAWTYGIGNVESYIYNVGFALDSIPPQVHDTVEYYDTVCKGEAYNGYKFIINEALTANVGTFTHQRVASTEDTLFHHVLHLTVLPVPEETHLTENIVIGDTLSYADTLLTTAGTYMFHLTAANGCDSVVTLQLTVHLPQDTVEYYDTLCLGESYDSLGFSVTPNVSGPILFERNSVTDSVITHIELHLQVWPTYDIEVIQTLTGGEALHFADTLIYTAGEYLFHFLTVHGCDSVVTLKVIDCSEARRPCVNLNRDFVDYDTPVLILDDCTEGSRSSLWRFDDGVNIRLPRARRQFHPPLPDSVSINLHTCDSIGCCTDTTFSIPCRIRSVWFPNVFTPDAENNNRFGCHTSMDVVEFELYIYNRLGLLVYSTNDINAPWDGSHDGTPLPQATYAYRWHLRDQYNDIHFGTGTVTLLR